MRFLRYLTAAVSVCSLAYSGSGVNACTNLLVTAGASADGSVMITYTCDGEFYPHLTVTPAADHEPGEVVKLWNGAEIAQVPHTYSVVGLINEHQLVIGETTFGGREELHNPDGKLEYWDMMHIALQRAKTAREAIQVMTSLVEEYGYASTGESFSIGDPHEAWILEMIGPGPGGKGALWVARRIPDGYISAHANKARISDFPLDDPENCLYSENVINFAVEKGYYDPSTGKPFSFCDAYCPATPKNQRYAGARVWSLFRRAAPSLHLSPDYHRAVPGAKPYPLWIKPDKPLSVSDVFALMRDHYEGTDYDMTKGIDAGPYGNPYRWRPMYWNVDGEEYAWERPISTQQTAFSFVSQSRRNLPDAVGGLLWYGLDDTAFTCYMPLYCSITDVPESFRTGGLDHFSWDSAFWVFNFVSNFAGLKYSYMHKDIVAVQQEIENTFLQLQPAVEQTGITLALSNPPLARKFLTDYSVSHADMTVRRWKLLGEYLIRKYNDGYVQKRPGRPSAVGYPDAWLRRVLRERPNQYRLPEDPSRLPATERDN